MDAGRFANRVIVVGVTGGIAAYKTVQVVSTVRRLGGDVYVVMTPSATHFVGPLTFQVLSAHPVVSDLWSPDNPWDEPHVFLGERAHLYLIAPATAHMLAKLALGLSDDVVSATALATRAPVLVAPSMSDLMYEHPATQVHLRTLRERGYQFVGPEVGRLASGKEGIGRMAEPETIVEEMATMLEAR